MRLLSFDVGVKNLSGCLLEYSDASEAEAKVIIEWWGIVSLLDENPAVNSVCGCTLANGSLCGKPAKWTAAANDGDAFYCTRHKDKHAQEELLILPQSPPGECATCKKTAKYKVGGSGDLLCAAHKKSALTAHKRATQLVAIKAARCCDQTVDTTKLNLWKRLDALPALLAADIVLIENQPALKNPTMKAVAETLYSYWLCRGIVDKERTHSTIGAVKYVSASNKLKIVPNSQIALKGLTGAAKYKRTKELSIAHVATLLKEDDVGLAFFSAHRKKDDLSDAILQAAAYLVMTCNVETINQAQYRPSS